VSNSSNELEHVWAATRPLLLLLMLLLLLLLTRMWLQLL